MRREESVGLSLEEFQYLRVRDRIIWKKVVRRNLRGRKKTRKSKRGLDMKENPEFQAGVINSGED